MRYTICIGVLLLISGTFFFSCGTSESKSNMTKEAPSKVLEPSAPIQAAAPKARAIPPEPPTPKAAPLPDYDTTKWVDIYDLDATIFIDMKYATTDNFVEEEMYECGRCFLRPEVAKAVVQAHHLFQEGGYRLKMLDCYRPRPVQQLLWDKVPNPSYVTPPEKGSMHNRGAAVDITLVDANGAELDMGTPFDFFGKKAHYDYEKLPKEVIRNRQLLRKTMEQVGFKGIRTEWWHFSYRKKGGYPISDYLWKCEH